MNIYHITSRQLWIEAIRQGVYESPSLDADGFVHCSAAAQVIPVARQFFAGQSGLVLLVMDTSRLTSELKWETSVPPPGVAKGARFPHIYGPINLDAIVQAIDFEPDRGGDFTLPRLSSQNDMSPGSKAPPSPRKT